MAEIFEKLAFLGAIFMLFSIGATLFRIEKHLKKISEDLQMVINIHLTKKSQATPKRGGLLCP